MADMLVAMYVDVNHPVTLFTIKMLASCVGINGGRNGCEGEEVVNYLKFQVVLHRGPVS